MKVDALVKYSIAISCIFVLAIVTVFKTTFTANFVILAFTSGIILSIASIYFKTIRKKFSDVLFIGIGLYIGLFFYVLYKSPTLTFGDFKADTVICFLIILITNLVVFISKIVYPKLAINIDDTSKFKTTLAVIVLLIFAFGLSYIVYVKYADLKYT